MPRDHPDFYHGLLGRPFGVVVLICAGCLLAPAAALATPQGDEAIERLRAEAVQHQRDGDLEGALQKYALLSEQFPEAPEAAEALLQLIVGYRGLERDEEAEVAAQTLTRDHPRSHQAAGAYTFLGELEADRAGDEAELDLARGTLEKAVLLFPRTAFAEQPWRAEASVRGARVALRLGRDAEAAHALADVIDLEPRSPWTAAARLELAALLLEQDDWRQAGDLLQEVVDSAGEGDDGGAAAALAESRLGLIHRLGLRPEGGRDRWRQSRVVGAVPERPNAVAAGEEGKVAVAGAKGSTVVLDRNGQPGSRWAHDEGRRNSWRGSDLIVAIDEAAATFPEGRGLRFAAPPSEKKKTNLGPLVAVEAAPYGHWLVLAEKPTRVMLYESGRRLHVVLVEGKGREPVDLARDRRGRLLVLDRKARSVTRFAAGDESGERLIAGGWDRAEALAVDAVGNVYVLDRGKRRIEMYDRDGKRLQSLGPSLPGGLELQRPADLTVDGAGRIWIADTKLGLVVLE